MLNDIRVIEQAMVSHGVAVAARHPDIKDMAKGNAFRIRLSEAGAIVAVELIADAGRGVVWTLRDGQHNGFPALRTTAGLLSLDSGTSSSHQQTWESAKTPAQRRGELMRLFGVAVINPSLAAWPSAGHRRRIAERLDLLQPLIGDPASAAVPAAFERFLTALAASPNFAKGLLAYFVAAVPDCGDEWLEPIRNALLGPATLAIDVDETDFDRDAGDARQIGPVSAALGGGTQGANTGVACALSGAVGHLHSGNFPQPNLPGLGQTYLFSRNKDIPSLKRYGHTADASFPIGSDLVRRLSGVISSLTEPDAKGRSWRLIPAETGDKPDLLVTSLRSIRAADAIAADDDEDDDTVDGQTAWSELGAQFIHQTRGEETGGAPLDGVVILILRTVDPANRKAIYRRTMTATEIFEATRRWQAATANVPDWLGFIMPTKGEKTAKLRTAPFVKPLSITPLSRNLFANGGRRRVAVIGVTASDAFGLFLRDGDTKKRAGRLLSLLLHRHGPLLSGVAAAKIRGGDSLKKFDPKTDLRRDARRSITWIGALLYDIGRFSSERVDMPEMTSYTESLAFRLGQLLSAADYVHKGYCADLRGGALPPALIGNSVLAVAGADPTRALAILASRLKPYLAWADRSTLVRKKAAEEEERDKGRAIALRQGLSQARQAKSAASMLSVLLSPYKSREKMPDDAFKAELLLGYMAGFPPLSKKGDAVGREASSEIDDDDSHTDEDDQG